MLGTLQAKFDEALKAVPKAAQKESLSYLVINRYRQSTVKRIS